MCVWVGCVFVCVQRKLSPNGEVGESESQGKDRDRRDGPGIVQSIGQFCWAVISSENKRFFDKWRNIKTEWKNANIKLGMVISSNTNFTDFHRLRSHPLPNTHSHTHPIPALTSHTHQWILCSFSLSIKRNLLFHSYSLSSQLLLSFKHTSLYS